LSTETDLPMFEEIVKFPDVKYIAGGATQNAIRGAQWMFPTPFTHFIGSIGDDENGKKLNKQPPKTVFKLTTIFRKEFVLVVVLFLYLTRNVVW